MNIFPIKSRSKTALAVFTRSHAPRGNAVTARRAPLFTQTAGAVKTAFPRSAWERESANKFAPTGETA